MNNENKNNRVAECLQELNLTLFKCHQTVSMKCADRLHQSIQFYVILGRMYMCNILFIISKKIKSNDSSMNTPKQIMDAHVTFVCTDLLLTHTGE